MDYRTEGIVLRTTKYSENSLITKIYTRECGLQSYIISNSRGKKTKHPASLLQHLSLVELVVSNAKKTGLSRISEIGLLQPYVEIPFNMVKNSIFIFLNELLYKAIKEEHEDWDLFEFIKNSLLVLDVKQDSCSNFHVYFMVHLSSYLGFAPQENTFSDAAVFDLKEGQFVASIPSHSLYLNRDLSQIFQSLITANYEHIQHVKMDRQQRKDLLQALILYYTLHIPSFGEMKSLSILEQIASE